MLHTPAWDHPALGDALTGMIGRSPVFTAAEEWRLARLAVLRLEKKSPGYGDARHALAMAERKLDEATALSILTARKIASETVGGRGLRKVHDMFYRLQPGDVITAKEIALDTEMSERAVYRHVRSLISAGFPVVSEAGIGYTVRKMDHHIGRHAPREEE